MINFFERCADIASVGIIVDFTEDTEHVLSALLQILRLGIQRLSILCNDGIKLFLMSLLQAWCQLLQVQFPSVKWF